jgi:hypothetical protein
MIRSVIIAGALLFSLPAFAQAGDSVSPLIGPPIPSNVTPATEKLGGAVGVDTAMYATADHQHPRITRATNCTLAADGTCSVTWATPLTGTPQIVTTPVNSPGTQPITCNLTAAPTASSASIKCWIIQTTTLSLAIVTTGLNLAPATTAPAGTVVQLIALPPTQ